MAQVFSCEFCEISKNNLSYRTPLLRASLFSSLSLHPEILSFQKYVKKVPKLTQVDLLSRPIWPFAKTSKTFQTQEALNHFLDISYVVFLIDPLSASVAQQINWLVSIWGQQRHLIG